jgi:hypothetical protein
LVKKLKEEALKNSFFQFLKKNSDSTISGSEVSKFKKEALRLIDVEFKNYKKKFHLYKLFFYK